MTKMPPRGFKCSKETCDRISKSKLGELNPNFGKPRSKETKDKISISETGKAVSKKTRALLSKTNEGKIMPKEICGKISKSNEGKHTGKLGSGWKGGISFEPYCPKFNEKFKERVRKFFNYTCQKCGHIWRSGETKLSVHHVHYNKNTCCDNSKPLFVPLCSGKCHAITNRNREYWENIFTQKIMLEYDGECYIR